MNRFYSAGYVITEMTSWVFNGVGFANTWGGTYDGERVRVRVRTRKGWVMDKGGSWSVRFLRVR